jgi:hypothetical protein
MPNRGEEERDASYALKTNEHGVIDKIIANGKEIVRSTVMAIRSANYDFVNIGRPWRQVLQSVRQKGTVGMCGRRSRYALHRFGARARYRHPRAAL